MDRREPCLSLSDKSKARFPCSASGSTIERQTWQRPDSVAETVSDAAFSRGRSKPRSDNSTAQQIRLSSAALAGANRYRFHSRMGLFPGIYGI